MRAWVSYNLPIILPTLGILMVVFLLYIYQREMRLARHHLAHANTVITRLFENSADGVVIFDVAGRVESLNKAAERLYGWSESEIRGQVLPMIPDFKRERVRNRLQTSRLSELLLNRETQHVTASGELVDLNVTWSALTIEGNSAEGFLLVARDLTEVRRLEKELLHLNYQLISLNTLSRCLAGSAEMRPTIETAVTELVNNLNLAYCQLNSIVSDSGGFLPTLRIGSVQVDPEFLGELTREVEGALTPVVRGLTAALPIRVLDRSVGSLVVVFADDNMLEKRLKVLETFTQQVAALLYAVTLLYKERETAERITELTRLRGDFVAMVSHELRTPLTCIKGFVDTLLRPDMQWEREDQAEFMHSIKVSTEQALSVVEDLLAVQQAEYGRLTIHCEPVNLGQLVEESCRRAQSISHNHAIKWSIPEQSIVLKADPIRLTQVLDNLLSNAIKYSPLGGDVVVKVKQGDGQAEVSITDNGVGIEQEHQTLIFEKFFRADNSAARRTDGLGLGLSIVQSIISLHGGKVWLTSVPNKGSTFYFTLPSQG